MKKNNLSLETRRLVTLSMLIATAMILSYVERLLPPLVTGIPGIRLGLANIATVFTLYALGWKYAIVVTLMRVSLSAILFGNFEAFIFSMLGGALALASMIIFKKLNLFSTVGVSVIGGVFHNIGQIIAAFFVMKTDLTFYFIPLLISGTVAGVLIGLASGTLVERIKKYI